MFLFAGCDSTEARVQREVLAYFTGPGVLGTKGGRMISSLNGIVRDQMIKQARIIEDLNEEWKFFDDEISLMPIEKYDFITRYKLRFKNINSGEIYSREETYYSNIDISSTPFLLEVDAFVFNGKSRRMYHKAVWKGDFAKQIDSRDISGSTTPE